MLPLSRVAQPMEVRDSRRVLLSEQGEVVATLDDVPLAALAEPVAIAQKPPTSLEAFHGGDYSQGEFETEHNAKLLRRRDRLAEFRKLWIGDPLVRSTLDQVTLPVRQATWTVERGEVEAPLPDELEAQRDEGGETDEAKKKRLAIEVRAEIARRVIAANLLGEGPSEWRMDPQGTTAKWEKILGEGLATTWSEVVWWEPEFERRTGKVGGKTVTAWVVKRLLWIDPESVDEIHIDEHGEFLGIVQCVQSQSSAGKPGAFDQETVTDRWIDAKLLITHSFDALGADVSAGSMVRPMYMSALRAQTFRKLRVIHGQRTSAPVPIYAEEEGADPQNLERGIKTVKGLRGGAPDLGWIYQPKGVEYKLMDVGSNATDTTGPIRAEADDIFSVAGEEHRRLGSAGAGGTQALAGQLTQFFKLRLVGMAKSLRDTLQQSLVEWMFRVNWDDGNTPTPILSVADVTPPELEPILNAIDKGAVQTDGDVENATRKALKLKPLDAAAVEKRNSMRGMPSFTGDGAGLRAVWDVFGKMTQDGYLEGDDAAGLLSPITGRATWADPDKMGTSTSGGAAGPGGPEFDEDGRKNRTEDIPPAMKRAQNALKKAAGKSVEGEKPPANGDAPKELAEVGVTRTASEPGNPIGRDTWRPPTPFEARFVRLGDIDDTFNAFATRFHQRGRRLYEDAVESAVKQVSAGPQKQIRLKSKPWLDFMEDAADVMLAFGSDQAEEEIRRQVGAIEDGEDMAELADFDKPLEAAKDKSKATERLTLAAVTGRVTSELEVLLSTDVTEILENIITGVRRAFAEAMRTGVTETAAKEVATEVMLSSKNTLLDRIGRGIASHAYNGGRREAVAEARETFEATPLDVEVAIRSEVLDGATCSFCRNVDGTVVEIDSPDFEALSPPNGCAGQSFCRGEWLWEVRRKAA